MDYITRALDYLDSFADTRGPAPRFAPPTRNRIDADTKLICYHDTGRGAKPPPRQTDFLPVRTRTFAPPFSDIAKCQAEAGYEEIDSIPAAALGLRSEFGAGHVYVVHPVTYWQVRDMSNKVLLDLKEWVEETCPNELFTRKARHVLVFKSARKETVEEIYKELDRRMMKGDVGNEPGYTGDWELMNGEDAKADEARQEPSENAEGEVRQAPSENADKEEGKSRPSTISRLTEAGLEMAREAGRKAAEDANDEQDWDFAD
jgi:hypothetical protein